ncbi:nuclear transport factor 2 [Lasiosphaeria miniovina]|uniref:Nuclear transport factor 2 n=1 Tax=Lasiosphaeria miniovina TaxID=1954250 RepID=A0AA40DQI7_9PEZI|nr:nuclear transport factor 2 [Lasiosphaeria miniovina]KAK0709567.1 nuclear transport factor 2 [Lasiosphaeria miniovina]
MGFCFNAQFVGHYYSTFDSNRADLAGLYRDNSMLTFQSAQELGAAAIAQKLVSLPFQKVKHQPVTTEAQPTPGGGIVILVTGQLLVDDEQNPLSYSQAFQLSKDQAGNWYVFNDIFTLV